LALILFAMFVAMEAPMTMAVPFDGLPKGTTFTIEGGRFTHCNPPPGSSRTAEFKAACRQAITDQGRARQLTVVGDSRQWVTSADYPATAVAGREAGTSLIKATIGTDGKVSGCVVTTSSGYPDLDDAACSAFSRHAEFLPAIDRDGVPVAVTYSRQVVWRAP
jgi:TonB family protein